MSLIVDTYDLSNGNTESTEVVSPNNWRVTATTTGCPAFQYVRVDFEVEDEAGNWSPLTDEDDHAIHITLRGNATKSVGALGVNGANGRVVVRPQTGQTGSASGTINVDSINS